MSALTCWLLTGSMLLGSPPGPVNGHGLTISFDSQGSTGMLGSEATPDAMLDLGNVSGTSEGSPTRSQTWTIRRSIVLRLRSDTGVRGPARVWVSLASDSPTVRVRLDGRVLSTTPQLISPNAPVGRPLSHNLEIEVSSSAAPGPLETILTWSAETL
jgi:hypothetical protein